MGTVLFQQRLTLHLFYSTTGTGRIYMMVTHVIWDYTTSVNPHVTQEVYPRGMDLGYTSWATCHTSWDVHSKRYGVTQEVWTPRTLSKRYVVHSKRYVQCNPRGMQGATQEVWHVTQEVCAPTDTCKRYEIHSKRYGESTPRMALSLLGHMLIPLGQHLAYLLECIFSYLLERMDVTQEVWHWHPRGMKCATRGMPSVTQGVYLYLLDNRYTSWVTPNPYLLERILHPKRYEDDTQEVCMCNPRGMKTQSKRYESYIQHWQNTGGQGGGGIDRGTLGRVVQ